MDLLVESPFRSAMDTVLASVFSLSVKIANKWQIGMENRKLSYTHMTPVKRTKVPDRGCWITLPRISTVSAQKARGPCTVSSMGNWRTCWLFYLLPCERLSDAYADVIKCSFPNKSHLKHLSSLLLTLKKAMNVMILTVRHLLWSMLRNIFYIWRAAVCFRFRSQKLQTKIHWKYILSP